jgi:hypothetical protein
MPLHSLILPAQTPLRHAENKMIIGKIAGILDDEKL